jgi:uncharacterized oligopeptide transporter (OPT) family protein
MNVVIFGSLALAVFLVLMPGLPTQGNVLVSVLIVLFGFFFATVSSRITGLIGSSSNPISGMTIATLIITCVIFVALGWNDSIYAPVALSVGAIICICAANAGNTSQDLKTGYIVGATPKYQQMGLAIGVITSSFVIGYTIIRGLLDQELPWGLVLVGVFIAITLELCGVHSLSFSVGAYLPIATTAPIFIGGMVRWWVERNTAVKTDSDISAGVLFSSGLIAGGSLLGILYAILYGVEVLPWFSAVGDAVPFLRGESAVGHIAGALLFLALAVVLARFAQRRIE